MAAFLEETDRARLGRIERTNPVGYRNLIRAGQRHNRVSVPHEVIAPDDAGYEEARKVYNAMIDKHPRVIVRSVNAGDVMPPIAEGALHGTRSSGASWRRS